MSDHGPAKAPIFMRRLCLVAAKRDLGRPKLIYDYDEPDAFETDRFEYVLRLGGLQARIAAGPGALEEAAEKLLTTIRSGAAGV